MSAVVRGHRSAAILRMTAAALVVAGLMARVPERPPGGGADAPRAAGFASCSTGDDIPAGHDVSELRALSRTISSRSPEEVGRRGASTTSPRTGRRRRRKSPAARRAQTWNYRPDLITLTVGEQNTTIVKLITDCFDDVKNHDFTGASTCASAILGNSGLWTQPQPESDDDPAAVPRDHGGRPSSSSPSTGYPNPYPKALTPTERSSSSARR